MAYLQIMENKCVKCGTPTTKELERCEECKTEHQRLADKLDAQPKQKIEKIPEKWVSFKQVKKGIMVTTYMTKAEAQMMGKQIND